MMGDREGGGGRGSQIDLPPEKTTLKKPSLIRVRFHLLKLTFWDVPKSVP